MPKRRTREDKKNAVFRTVPSQVPLASRDKNTYSLRSDQEIKSKPQAAVSRYAFGFDQGLVIQDVMKTLIVSLFIVGILITLTLQSPW